MHQNAYCDEFGNTGGQLLPTGQPILVYAFVLLDASRVGRLTESIRELYRKEDLRLTELKSSTLVRSRRGLARYASIATILKIFGAKVSLSVVEKRYQVCAMIVETYLDPALHDKAPRELLSRHFRQKVVDACYESLNDVRLVEFLVGVSSDDAAAIARIGRRISDILRLHPDSFVAHCANCVESRPDKVFRYAEARSGFPLNANIPASQFSGFYPGVQCVEAYLSRLEEYGDLICDEDVQFGEALALAFQHGRELDYHPEARLYGATKQLMQLGGIRSGSSADEVGIQIADLAAGLFGRVAGRLVGGQQVPKSLQELVEVWRVILAPPDVHYWMVSDRKLPAVLSGIFGSEMSYGSSPPWEDEPR